MKITENIELYCPIGFYCKRNGKDGCNRLRIYNNAKYYCEVFIPFLEEDAKGNVLKCEQCLLAERKARLSNG